MTVEKIEFQGFKNCYKITWGHFRMIITEDVGPRILSLSHGENNVSIFGMKTHHNVGDFNNDQWNLFGGHRLWTAPENRDRTYYPDNKPIQIEIINDSLIVMRQAIEHITNIKKTITLEFIHDNNNKNDRFSHIEVNHYLENKGVWSINCAPWAISVMGKGTKAIIPLSNNEPSGLLPKTSLSIWNYTKLQDQRLTLGNKYIMMQQQDRSSDPDGGSSNKIGSRVNSGWCAATNHSTLFVKIIDQDTNDLHCDLGANVEVYTDNDILELETVGKYLQLDPTSPVSPPLDVTKVIHSSPHVAKLTEKWYLFPLEEQHKIHNDNDVDKYIIPIINDIYKSHQHHHQHHYKQSHH